MTGSPDRPALPNGRLVLLAAKDPARRRELAAALIEAGHAPTDAAAPPWEAALIDLEPGEEDQLYSH